MDTQASLLKQHLIDPEICIRCNTCEAICPVGAITHDSMNYVVKADLCNFCMDCISPCPTGSIDNWRLVPKAEAYSIEEQLKWHELPAEISPEELAAAGAVAEELKPTANPSAASAPSSSSVVSTATASGFSSSQYGATI